MVNIDPSLIDGIIEANTNCINRLKTMVNVGSMQVNRYHLFEAIEADVELHKLRNGFIEFEELGATARSYFQSIPTPKTLGA